VSELLQSYAAQEMLMEKRIGQLKAELASLEPNLWGIRGAMTVLKELSNDQPLA
jgi:hypothetical protein